MSDLFTKDKAIELSQSIHETVTTLISPVFSKLPPPTQYKLIGDAALKLNSVVVDVAKQTKQIKRAFSNEVGMLLILFTTVMLLFNVYAMLYVVAFWVAWNISIRSRFEKNVRMFIGAFTFKRNVKKMCGVFARCWRMCSEKEMFNAVEDSIDRFQDHINHIKNSEAYNMLKDDNSKELYIVNELITYLDSDVLKSTQKNVLMSDESLQAGYHITNLSNSIKKL